MTKRSPTSEHQARSETASAERPSYPSRIRLKLLLVTNDFPPRAGGIEQYFLTLLEGIKADRPIVVAPSQEDDTAFDRDAGFDILRLPGRGGRLWPTAALADYVSGLVRSRQVDVVAFTALIPLAFIGPRIAKQAGVPFVLWHHGAELAGLARIPGLRQSMARVARRADLQFAVSDWTLGEVERLLPGTAPTRLLRAGVDLERFNPSNDSDVLRAKLGFDGSIVLVCVGRLVPRKGQDTLIRILPSLLEQVPATRLLIVGEGPSEKRLRKLAESHGVAERVKFAGRVTADELSAYYSTGDVYVSPIRTRRVGLESEGFGVVFLEAAASGLPVIVGRSGGTVEAVLDGESGLLVNGDDDDDVRNACLTLLQDNDLRARMGRAGRTWMETDFDAAGMADRFRSAVAELMGLT